MPVRSIAGSEFAFWMADDSEGGKYIAVFNLSDEDTSLEFGMEELEEVTENAAAVELWSGKAYTFGSTVKVDLSAHGSKVFRI